jgi:AAA domain
MILIINGSVGVGKTETSWELLSQLGRAIMLDGDYIGAINPFKIYDQERVDYLYSTLAHLIQWHRSHSYQKFVINYVFEQPFQLQKLMKLLEPLDSNLHSFWLTCEEQEQSQRIVDRDSDHQWDLKRFIELNETMTAASESGNIGLEIDTSGKAIKQVAEEILAHVT